jgi:hypothetical protein
MTTWKSIMPRSPSGEKYVLEGVDLQDLHDYLARHNLVIERWDSVHQIMILRRRGEARVQEDDPVPS